MWPQSVTAVLENQGPSGSLDVQFVIAEVCSPFSFSFVFATFCWWWGYAFVVVVIDGGQSDRDWEKCT